MKFDCKFASFKFVEQLAAGLDSTARVRRSEVKD